MFAYLNDYVLIDSLQLTSQPHQCTSVRHVGVPTCSTQLYVLHDVVICTFVGCSRSSKRGKTVGFFRLPTVIRHQGEKLQNLVRGSVHSGSLTFITPTWDP